MDLHDKARQLLPAMEAELRAVARWWLTQVIDLDAGTIAGGVSNDNLRRSDVGLGLVYVSRLLWFFSALHRHEPGPEFRAAARLCHRVLTRDFSDRENGGLFWSVDAGGQPDERKKQTYGQSFAIYGLSEYARAFADDSALGLARQLVELLERHAHDRDGGGYLEALDANWQALDDVRLGDSDVNADKTMNTHLHVLEAYTNFHRANPGGEFTERLSGLVTLFLDRFVHPSGEFLLRYRKRDWQTIPAARSFGHDIEASWLLWESACALGDAGLKDRVRSCALALADAVLARGFDPRDGVINEWSPDGFIDTTRVWWVQAEAMVGFFNAWQLGGEDRFFDASVAVWQFIADHQRDRDKGEWFMSSPLDGSDQAGYKAGFWKGPYHNGRALMEMSRRMAGPARPEKE